MIETDGAKKKIRNWIDQNLYDVFQAKTRLTLKRVFAYLRKFSVVHCVN
jgi:hypothetical protein